jgi:hypothetical protein
MCVSRTDADGTESSDLDPASLSPMEGGPVEVPGSEAKYAKSRSKRRSVGTAVPQPNYSYNARRACHEYNTEHSTSALVRQQQNSFNQTDRRTHLEHARPMNTLPRRRGHSCLCLEDVPIEVCREVECAFPRLESALVRARDEISRRIDKCCGLFVRLLVGERELEAHVEEVPPRECVPRLASTTTSRRRECYRRI